MGKIIVIGLILSILRINSYCQNEIKPLKKGDIIPDMPITVFQGDSIFKTTLSNFKGKAILLDFWATNCVECIAAMPRMLDIQKKFSDKLQILYVTPNSIGDIKKLWRRFEGHVNPNEPLEWLVAGKQLSFITGDSIFSRLFPHMVFPIHVWIDSSQIFNAIAYATTTTVSNLQDFINGKKVSLDEQMLLDIDVTRPLKWLTQKSIPDSNLQYYSFFASYLEFGAGGYSPSYFHVDPKTQDTTGISCINHTILQLYNYAYRNWWKSTSENQKVLNEIPKNRFLLCSRLRQMDELLTDSTWMKWLKKNSFCYAMKLPQVNHKRFCETMREDLDLFFNVTSRIEKRKTRCWVLKRISRIDKLKTKGERPYYDEGEKLIIKNGDVFWLEAALSDIARKKNPELPFVDLTGYNGKIDIELPWNERRDLIDFNSVKKVLNRLGLDFVVEDANIELVVIGDN